MKTQLLCTFCIDDDLDSVLDEITKFKNLTYKYIYVLANADNEDDLFVTYNVSSDSNISDMSFTIISNGQTGNNVVVDTILIHRKKESNTLYTINALNLLIQSENNGVLDTSYEIDWHRYYNSILLSSNNAVKKINTKIKKVITL